VTVKAQDIAALVEMFEASRWDELHVELDGLHLFLSTDPQAKLASGSEISPARETPVAPASQPSPSVSGSSPADRTGNTAGKPEGVEAHWVAVTAPNLGTFYRAPKPGAPPFVAVGQVVEESTDLCLLEVMKLFTTVKAKTKGTIRRVCVNDSEMVEFDQPLFYIDPT
jgi:acetyl-CoA carboxylase biotin carboxyl carrier protein